MRGVERAFEGWGSDGTEKLKLAMGILSGIHLPSALRSRVWLCRGLNPRWLYAGRWLRLEDEDVEGDKGRSSAWLLARLAKPRRRSSCVLRASLDDDEVDAIRADGACRSLSAI